LIGLGFHKSSPAGSHKSQSRIATELEHDRATSSITFALRRRERGARNPTILVVERIAKALGVPAWELLKEPEDG
jgi:hypothetical protein